MLKPGVVRCCEGKRRLLHICIRRGISSRGSTMACVEHGVNWAADGNNRRQAFFADYSSPPEMKLLTPDEINLVSFTGSPFRRQLQQGIFPNAPELWQLTNAPLRTPALAGPA